MRGTILHMMAFGTAAVFAANIQSAYASSPPPLVVTARPRVTPIQAGREAWFEMTIKNATDSEQIVDVGLVMLTDTMFITPSGSKGLGQSTTDVNVTPPKCADWTAFAVLRPGASVTTLIRVQTPRDIQGAVQLELGFEFWHIVDLKDCRKEPVEASTKLDVQVRAP